VSQPILETINSIDSSELNEHLKLVHVSRKVELYKEGNPSKVVYIIKQGKVKIYQTPYRSENRILYIHTPGDIFGYHPMLYNEGNFASAMTIEECEFYVLEKKYFLDIVNKSADFMMMLLKNSCHELSVIINYIGAFSLKSGRERVALCLLILEEKYRQKGIDPVEITLSRADLASFSGIAFETLSRIITQFKNENLINILGRKITIINRPKLSILAKG